MEINYQLIDSDKLIVQKFSGSFTVEEYINYTRFIMPFLLTNPIQKVLNDLRGLDLGNLDYIPGDLSTNIERVTQFRKKIENNELKNKDVALVFWTVDPLPTLIAHLFTDNFPNKNYSYCTCKEDVIKFLSLPPDIDLDLITQNLKNSFEPVNKTQK